MKSNAIDSFARRCALLACACAATLAACASPVPPQRSAAYRPIARESAPPAAVPATDRDLIAQAGAFESFVRHARGIDPAFSGPAQVAQALQTGAAHQAAELETGMVAYAALAALQEPRFVAAVKADRSGLAQRLAADPRAVLALPGGEAAAGRASGALYAQGEALSDQGQKVKRAAYTVQHQAWSKGAVADPAGRMARVKRLSAASYQISHDDAQELAQSLSAGARRAGPPSPLVTRGMALAALSLLGEERQGRALLISEPRTGSCLKMAKLNLYQCLASAGPHYEDVFCLGQHAMIDPGQCVVDAARGPAPRQVAQTPLPVTRTSYRPERPALAAR